MGIVEDTLQGKKIILRADKIFKGLPVEGKEEKSGSSRKQEEVDGREKKKKIYSVKNWCKTRKHLTK